MRSFSIPTFRNRGQAVAVTLNAALISHVWFVATAVLSLAGCGTTMGEAGSPMRPGALYYNFSAPRSGDATSVEYQLLKEP
jgi:hypothetical protein